MVGIVAAGCLHLAFCEWRTLQYAADQPEPENRMVLFRRSFIATGNAEAWDRRDAELDRYNEAFLECYGTPTPEIETCVRKHPGGADTPTAIAVAITECESELRGAARKTAELGSCLVSAGYDRVHAPHWTFELIGPRFEGPSFRESALYAEVHTQSTRLNWALGWLLGGLGPAGLVCVCGRCAWRCYTQRRCSASAPAIDAID